MTTEFPHDGHHARVTVTRGVHGGWDVREERDSGVVRQVSYTDWHRVERALQIHDGKYEVRMAEYDVRLTTSADPGVK